MSNLDARLRNELRDEIKRLHQRLAATTMIYVAHDQIEAMMLADRIAVMTDQRIQELGSPLDIYYRPANRFVAGFVGSPQMNFIEGTIEQAAGGPAFAAGKRRLPLDGYAFSARPEPGRPVTLGIRPEHIALDGAGNWDGSRSRSSSRSGPTTWSGAPTAASRSRCARPASARSNPTRRWPWASIPDAFRSSPPMAVRGSEQGRHVGDRKNAARRSAR